MKKFLLTVALAAPLAACGADNPPQTVQNPLGLDDQTMSVQLEGAGPGGSVVAPLAAGTASVSGTFADNTDLSSLPINPATLKVEIDLAGATLSDACLPAPATLNVTVKDFTAKLSDAGREVNVAFPSSVSTTLTRSGNAYTASDFAPSLSTQVSGAALTSLLDIIKTGGVNSVSASAIVDVPELPGGCTITFTFDGGQGTIGF